VPRERVSVIIPARNAPRLEQTLESLTHQSDRDRIAEILVISSDPLPSSAATPAVRLIPTATPVTSPVARNVGIRAASADWFAFLDADCVAAPDWLGQLMHAAQSSHTVVGGGVAFGHSSYWGDVHNVSMLHDYHISAPRGPRLLLPTLNLLVHRKVIAEVGMMDEKLRRAQDLEWTVRMKRHGIELWFEPEAAVTHLPDRHPASLWRDYFETGQVSFRVRRDSDSQKTVPAWARSPSLLRILSPCIAAAATLRVFAKNPHLMVYLANTPGIWYTKLAWCLGAASI
jgi:glycosyltransferase involved in cell wall biosynthesis